MTEDMHEERLHAAEAFGNAVVSPNYYSILTEFPSRIFVQYVVTYIVLISYLKISVMYHYPSSSIAGFIWSTGKRYIIFR